MISVDNIFMCFENNKMTTKVEKLLVDEEEVLVRTLFTLVGTKQSVLDGAYEFTGGKLVNHHPYASVGRIEKIDDKSKGKLPEGACIYMPPIFSKYHCTSVKKIMHSCKIIPKDIDRVSALFLKFVFLGNKIIDTIKSYDYSSVCLLGCNVIGGVLAKLLHLEGISTLIIQDEEDIELLVTREMEHIQVAACTDIDINKYEMNHCVLIPLSDQPWAVAMENLLKEEDQAVNIMSLDDEIWECNMSMDDISEVCDFIQRNEIVFTDLIIQHVHAEYYYKSQEMIEKNKFKAKAIVYDW